MDEFDCFMDAANRNVSIAQLITFAKTQPHRQFILLTPLSITEDMLNEVIGSDNKVSIKRLNK